MTPYTWHQGATRVIRNHTNRSAKRRRQRHVRELARFWAAVLASDRATNAWGLKLIDPHLGSPAIRLAWAAHLAGRNESGSATDTAPERWARAEALLHTRWKPGQRTPEIYRERRHS